MAALDKTSLEYASPGTAGGSSTRVIGRLALIMAVGPQAAGVVAVAGYAATRSQAFVTLGMLLLVAGTISMIASIVLAGIYIDLASGLGRRTSRRGIWTMLLALSNLPVALLCVTMGSILTSQTHFAVQNIGVDPVEDVVLHIGAERVDVGSLAPGEAWTAWRRGIDPVFVEWKAAGTPHREQLDTYIQDGGGEVGVSLNRDRLK